jgi:hypothetical protein
MAKLSWPGVQYLVEALKKPLERSRAVESMVTIGDVQPRTARTYLAAAQALRLIIEGDGGSLALSAPGDAPTLLSTSALVRLMKAAQQLTLQPRPDTYFEVAERLGVHDGGTFWSAWHLARRARYLAPVSPQPALVLALVEVRAERLAPGEGNAAWDAAEAFEALNLLFAPAPPRRPETLDAAPPLEALDGARFARACHVLNARRLVEMIAVQHAFGAHAAYRKFGGPLGYVKTLALHARKDTVRHAEPVSQKRLRVSLAGSLGSL